MELEEYDQTLTDTHSYLGVGFEDIRGRTLLDDKSTHQLLVFGGKKITLIPGETLPLLLSQDVNPSSEVRNWLKQHRVFGILYPHQHVFGTTADMRGFREHCSQDGHWTFMVKAQGTQRFQLTERRIISRDTYIADVHILPDFTLAPPAQHLLLEKNRLSNVMGKLTAFPEGVYNQCKLSSLMKEVSSVIRQIVGKEPPVSDPIGFSYWVAANLPINDNERKILLSVCSSQERLFIAKYFLKLRCKIVCKECTFLVSTKEEIFSMSRSGAQGVFVNKHGYIHEMLTVRSVSDVRYHGASSEEYSWFPGYAWNVCYCAGCSAHLGWRFSTEKKLQPEEFWGLARAAVVFEPCRETSRGDDEANPNPRHMSRAPPIEEDERPEISNRR